MVDPQKTKSWSEVVGWPVYYPTMLKVRTDWPDLWIKVHPVDATLPPGNNDDTGTSVSSSTWTPPITTVAQTPVGG